MNAIKKANNITGPDEPNVLTLEGHIAETGRLIQETGYHRRDAELAELKQALEKP